ncbi:hypothetical protein ASG66_00290 [Bacillus sp. Leaf406]|nr:hypothetical protein ASG66_00290 [Bacillus sp. Leaf406]
MTTHSLALYEYLNENAYHFTEEWAARQRVKYGSHYSAEAPQDVQERVKEQNATYARLLAKCLIRPEEEMKEAIDEWTKKTAADRSRSTTTLDEVVRNSAVFRRVYWNFVKRFVNESGLEIGVAEVFQWEEQLNSSLDYVLERFTSHYLTYIMDRLQAQSDLINELSSPVISLTDEIGLLPLIGDIDTARARSILEGTLQQSSQSQLSTLIIDLSGVLLIDTMVAQQLFHLVDALNLLGVKSIMTGIRPEVAQTAIHLGLDFSEVRTENSLKRIMTSIFAT